MNVTSVRDDRHLFRMAMNDRTVTSRQLAARWSTATGVLMSASSIRQRLLHRGLRARVPLYRFPLTTNHRWLRLQWAHEQRTWQGDWHQVVFSDESRFNFGTMMAAFVLDAMPVNAAFQSALLNDIVA
ncbi:transposable element Tcb2 transposase [Trichonephila clavipes]|nr:transposable element Tcb2 transposase [Trichonephila clavipes]